MDDKHVAGLFAHSNEFLSRRNAICLIVDCKSLCTKSARILGLLSYSLAFISLSLSASVCAKPLSLIHSITHFTHSIHSLTQLPTQSLTSFAHSLAHSTNQLKLKQYTIHSLTSSFTHSFPLPAVSFLSLLSPNLSPYLTFNSSPIPYHFSKD